LKLVEFSFVIYITSGTEDTLGNVWPSLVPRHGQARVQGYLVRSFDYKRH